MIKEKHQINIKGWEYVPVLSVCCRIVSVLIILLFCTISDSKAATQKEIETDHILSSAESLFKAMKAKDYPLIWAGLSQQSKNVIVANILKAEKQRNIEHVESDIVNDFSSGNSLSRLYWDAYLSRFDVNSVLDESRWELDEIKNKSAGIKLHYRRSETPTILRMFKENGRWVTGLLETWPPKKS